MDGLDWSIKNIDLIRRIRKIRNISNHIRGPPAVCLLMPPHSCAWTALRGSGAVCDIRTTQVVLGWSRLVSLRLWRNVCVRACFFGWSLLVSAGFAVLCWFCAVVLGTRCQDCKHLDCFLLTRRNYTSRSIYQCMWSGRNVNASHKRAICTNKL